MTNRLIFQTSLKYRYILRMSDKYKSWRQQIIHLTNELSQTESFHMYTVSPIITRIDIQVKVQRTKCGLYF